MMLLCKLSILGQGKLPEYNYQQKSMIEMECTILLFNKSHLAEGGGGGGGWASVVRIGKDKKVCPYIRAQ